MKKDVLDKGFIEVVDHMGSDLTVVNAARVSFGKRKDDLDDTDVKLIKYLARNQHHSPFRHFQIQLHIKAPEFVMRQWYKHIIGAEWTSAYPTKDHAWNEISGRYVPVEQFYMPDAWRKQSPDNKQASVPADDDAHFQIYAEREFDSAMRVIYATYAHLLKMGVAREQARMLLPLNLYTEVYWTASLQAVCNFVMLRDHNHSQKEIRDYALALDEMMREILPISYSEMLKWMRTKV